MADSSSPVRGADLVNNEVEVGFDQHFEQRWIWVQRLGTAIMVVFILASLSGLLGRGPLSHHTEKSDESDLAVDYEPISRSQTPTQVTLHLHSSGSEDTLNVFLGSTSIEPMGLTRITPQPLETKTVEGGIMLTLAIPPDTRDGLVRLSLAPVGPGLFQQEVQVGDHVPLRWTQAVLP